MASKIPQVYFGGPSIAVWKFRAFAGYSRYFAARFMIGLESVFSGILDARRFAC